MIAVRGIRLGVHRPLGWADRMCWFVLALSIVSSGGPNPVAWLGMGGIAIAAAMYAWLRLPRAEAITGLILAGLTALAFAGLTGGGFVVCSVIAGVAYPKVIGPRRNEDDHFFLGTALAWTPILAFGAVASFAVPASVLTPFEAFHRFVITFDWDAFRKALAAGTVFEDADAAWGPLAWISTNRTAFAAGYLLAGHTFFAYLSVLWVRRYLWGAMPGRGRLMDFRIDVRYSPLIILVLAGFVLAPYAKAIHPQSVSIVLVFWLGMAIMFAGLGLLITLSLWSRFVLGVPALAVYIGVVLLIFRLGQLVLVAGLTDIWADWRKWLVRWQKRIEQKRQEGE